MSLPLEHARSPGDPPFGAAALAADLRAVRERAPLVHNVTNFVVMQQTAHALLACRQHAFIGRGAFCAVQPDALRAAVDAIAVMGVAGELALADARGRGTMAASFFDVLHQRDSAELDRRLRGDASP